MELQRQFHFNPIPYEVNLLYISSHYIVDLAQATVASVKKELYLFCSCMYQRCFVLLNLSPPPRRHLLHPRELRPAARCSHLRVGLHSGHPGFLRHLHLRVWHRDQRDHDDGPAAMSPPRLRGYYGSQGPGLNTRWDD